MLWWPKIADSRTDMAVPPETRTQAFYRAATDFLTWVVGSGHRYILTVLSNFVWAPPTGARKVGDASHLSCALTVRYALIFMSKARSAVRS